MYFTLILILFNNYLQLVSMQNLRSKIPRSFKIIIRVHLSITKIIH